MSIKLAQNLLKSMDWVKRKGTTAKRAMNPALYDKLPFTWKSISEKVFEHKISKYLIIINFDRHRSQKKVPKLFLSAT